MSKSVDIFFPLYIGDYQKKTQMLSCEEHGAYLLLIMALYQSSGSIPFSLKKMSRICRLSQSEFEEVWSEVECYFDVSDVVTNRRVTEEIGKAKDRKEIARLNGKKGGRPPNKNPNDKLNETQNKPSGLATDNPNHNPNHNLNETSSPSPSPSPSPKKANTPLIERQIGFATLTKENRPANFPIEEIKTFIDYWTEISINGKKMRFEKEKTFGIGRRLGTWMKNVRPKYGEKKNYQQTNVDHLRELSKVDPMDLLEQNNQQAIGCQ